MINARDKRASALAGFVAPLIAPFAPDGAIGTADRAHAGGWAYRGIMAEDLSYLSDVYQQDTVSATGSVADGTAQAAEAIYGGVGAIGTIAGGSIQPRDTIYDE